ncbi:hypothetical protein Mpsy_2392 [Methanolobus psychrophilus R15]|nr:hypothetical protein Mpsy_2392 [Methanolobus psychrophilus R15]
MDYNKELMGLEKIEMMSILLEGYFSRSSQEKFFLVQNQNVKFLCINGRDTKLAASDLKAIGILKEGNAMSFYSKIK